LERTAKRVRKRIPVKLVTLFTMSHRQTASIYSDPLPGGETIGWNVGEGTVTGERLRGKLQRANRPWHRADGLQVPDSHGVVTTDDGAVVFFEFHGLGRAADGETPPVAFGAFTFRTADTRYGWLNSVFAVAERRDRGDTPVVTWDAYECRPGGDAP
jgi:hypothetical protein